MEVVLLSAGPWHSYPLVLLLLHPHCCSCWFAPNPQGTSVPAPGLYIQGSQQTMGAATHWAEVSRTKQTQLTPDSSGPKCRLFKEEIPNSHQSLSGLNIREARIQPKLSTRNCGALKETKGTWWQQVFLGLASDYPGQELANCHCCVAFSPRNEKIPGRLPSPCSCCDSAVSNTHGGWLKMGSAVSTGQFCPEAGCCPPKSPGRGQRLYNLKLL